MHTHETLESAAKFINLYEKNQAVGADVYRYMACVIAKVLDNDGLYKIIKDLSINYPAVIDIIENRTISNAIETNREYYCPELDDLMFRLTNKG
jgi:hypothetical protein